MALRRLATSVNSIATRRLNLNLQNHAVAVRWYRGDSGDMKHRRDVSAKKHDDEIVKREEALLVIAEPKAIKIQERHVRMPKLEEIPKASLPPSMREQSAEMNESSLSELELEVRKKRLVYRSKQRGWLEVDLLLGTWASINVPSLNLDELDQFEDFVNLESTDIYNIITLRTDVPEFMKREDGEGVVEKIQEWARSSPLGKGEPDKYSEVKKDHNLI
uniref:Succinate dehydrogenase assembly factor 2, mitochondrial n=1 Tax=Chaetoceros debilis TaxID=122233 RepID=A0A6S8W9C2_9STRA